MWHKPDCLTVHIDLVLTLKRFIIIYYKWRRVYFKHIIFGISEIPIIIIIIFFSPHIVWRTVANVSLDNSQNLQVTNLNVSSRQNTFPGDTPQVISCPSPLTIIRSDRTHIFPNLLTCYSATVMARLITNIFNVTRITNSRYIILWITFLFGILLLHW